MDPKDKFSLAYDPQKHSGPKLPVPLCQPPKIEIFSRDFTIEAQKAVWEDLKNHQFLILHNFFAVCTIQMIFIGVLIHVYAPHQKNVFWSWPTSSENTAFLLKFADFSKNMTSLWKRIYAKKVGQLQKKNFFWELQIYVFMPAKFGGHIYLTREPIWSTLLSLKNVTTFFIFFLYIF